MKILFLGALCRKEQETDLISKSKVGIQNSIINFQWNIITGIELNIGMKLDIVNILPVGTYPRYYKSLFLKAGNWNQGVDAKRITLGTINLPIVKQILLILGAKHAIKRWIKENRNERLCIVSYDLLFVFLMALKSIRKRYPSITTCAVVADLPNEYGYKKSDTAIKSLLRRIMGKVQLKEIRKTDCFGLLTEQMKHPLRIDNGNYVIIEGISLSNEHCGEKFDSRKKVVLYTGALKRIYGLDILLDAFMNIKNEEYELWLCGSGDFEEEIVRASSIDPRIVFLGYRHSKQISKLQAMATVLVNPRQNIGEYTKYSFPSKIMEYLASGNPVIAYKLNGIPDEYDDFLIYPKDDSVEALRNSIIEVCDMPEAERQELGKAGSRFVQVEKNPAIQTKKLLDLIRSTLQRKQNTATSK